MLARILRPTPTVTALMAAAAVVFAVGATRLGFWTEDGPGAGLLPFATAVLLLPLLALVLRKGSADEEPFAVAPVGAVLLTGAYAAALPYLGFLLATVMLVVAWIRLLYGQSWGRAVALGIGLTAAASVLFVRFLQVPMPLLPAWS